VLKDPGNRTPTAVVTNDTESSINRRFILEFCSTCKFEHFTRKSPPTVTTVDLHRLHFDDERLPSGYIPFVSRNAANKYRIRVSIKYD
jgi:hypothetical protein